MPTLKTLRPWLLTILCIVLLATRMGGAHLHFCFDGGEPRVSLHGLDSGLHHTEPQASTAHQDLDLAADAVTLLSKLQVDLPVLLMAAVLLFGLLSGNGPVPARLVQRFISSLAVFLRPPLRGPPLYSLV